MAFLEWTDSLDVGVSDMNDQHQVIIKMMNDLWDANKAGGSRNQLSTGLRKLAEYTTLHFRKEEALMASVNYEGLKKHKLVHQNLLDELQTYYKEFAQSQEQSLSPKLFNFLRLWLRAHIQAVDTKYAAVVKAKSRAA